MTTNIIATVCLLLTVGVPLALLYADIFMTQKSNREKKDDITYDYDPKNWDHLNH
jgi:hypothetical protein